MRYQRGLIVTMLFFSILIPARAALGQSKPYSLDDVADLVKGGVPNISILAKAKASCLSFRLSSDAAARLRDAGAGDALVSGLASACYKGEGDVVTPAPTRAKPVARRVVVIHDTVPTKSVMVIHDTVTTNSVVVIHDTLPTKVVVTPTIVIPEGTGISASLAEELSSKNATLGDRVRVLVEEDVVMNGAVVIARGTPIRAEVAEVKRAGRLGKGGKLSLKLLGTTTVDGQAVAIRATKGSDGGNNTTSTIVLTVLFGPLGLFHHGNDMVYKQGTHFSVFTDTAVTLDAPRR